MNNKNNIPHHYDKSTGRGQNDEQNHEIGFQQPCTSLSIRNREIESKLSQNISDKENLSHLKQQSPPRGTSSTMGRKPLQREKSLKSVTEKKTRKENWLLTRKTWRYMADAGRKLIPDGVQNKPENLARIEEHFQHLCANEKKFLIWKRKLSYPGASGSFRRKHKSKLGKKMGVTISSPPTGGSSADECEDERSGSSRKGTDDLIIKMLEKYLSSEADIMEMDLISESNNGSDGTKLSKTDLSVDELSTIMNKSLSMLNKPKASGSKVFEFPPKETARVEFSSSVNEKNLDISKGNVQDQSIWCPGNFNELHSSILLDSLKQYRKKNYSPYIESDQITVDLLKDRVLLRKILNDIRTQQKFSKSIPRTESTRSLNISYSSSMSSLTSTISSTFHNFVDYIDNKANSCRNSLYRQNEFPGAGPYSESYQKSASTSTVGAGMGSKVSTSLSASSPLSKTHQIYNQQKQIFASKQQMQLYNQQQTHYQKQKKIMANLNKSSSTMLKSITTKTTSTTTILTSKQSDFSPPLHNISPSLTGDENIGSHSIAPKKVLHVKVPPRTSQTQTDGISMERLNILFDEYKKQVEEERREESEAQEEAAGRGKGGVDNEDVSQSVSDTIKRYLRMARKKPKNSDDANRFKSVNYDRNLRNIKAKGEITKPGDDDGLSKGCQTENNWLDSLFRNTEELNRCANSPIIAPVILTSPPPSPSNSGLLHQSTQFLSNLLWHHSSYNSNPLQTSNSTSSSLAAAAMQKSKSSSNVGHLVSKKIFRSRSKSQTRGGNNPLTIQPAPPNTKPQWTPQGNCVWISYQGKKVQLRDVFLPNLTEVERIVFDKISQDKIMQLGITVSLVPNTSGQQAAAPKPQKRRVLLLKRKAITTGFFDSSSKGKDDVSSKGGLVFGMSLEQCIENDSRSKNKDSRSARSSLSSLLDHQQRDRSGSCESLPAKTDAEYMSSTFVPLLPVNLDRRGSTHEDELVIENLPGVQHRYIQQVPSIVQTCIKFLEEHGLTTVGIFRVSTSKKRVRQLREDFDKGLVTSIDSDICPHDIATLIKEFFRDLPDPLLCRHLYKGFLQTQMIRNRRLQLEAISNLIHLLPKSNRDTLYMLLKFLGKVARAANDTTTYDGQILSYGNKMDSNNLATVIAPNILHCINSDQLEDQEIAERADVINIIRIMIDHYEDLFIVTSDDMNEIYTNMMDIYPQQLDYLLDRLYTRLEEDIDSGSSIPPLSPPYNATFSDDEKVVSPILKATTTTTMETPQKVVYSREDILHENAGKSGAISARRIRDRELRARLKYKDDKSTRRRQSDRTESGDLSSSSSTHESYQHSSGISVGGDRDYFVQTISSADDYLNKTRSSSMDSNASSDVFESANRRMSSPLASHSVGVLTASLKIPVQVQSAQVQSYNSSGAQNIQFYVKERINSHNIGDNITDIPFIEDTGGSFDTPEDGARSVTITTKRLDEIQKIQNINAPTSSLAASSSKIPTKKSIKSSSTGQMPLSFSAISNPRPTREQNYTPSISNIGGVVLRSKTADFEKKLQNLHQVSSSSQVVSSPSTNITNINISLTSKKKLDTAGLSEKIYKRNQLISSVQKSSKK